MKVLLAKRLGFCFGVKRALELTEDALRERGSLAMLGALIHNKAVVSRLAEKGLITVNSVDEVSTQALVIRAHGVTRDVYAAARRRGITLIDATCPFVKKAQEGAALLVEEGYSVLLAGDRDHSEVRGIVSAAGGSVHVVSDKSEIPVFPSQARVGLLFQTTQSLEFAGSIVASLLEVTSELRVLNTICRATTDRQRAVRELAPQVSAMVIVGDRKSANTARLTAISRQINERTVQVEGPSQLSADFFSECSSVGISAGASTPDWIIDEVRRYFEKL